MTVTLSDSRSGIRQLNATAETAPRSATHHLGFAGMIVAISHKIEFGDLVLLLYIAAFVRQYLWLTDNQVIAWASTIVLTIVVWLLHINYKELVEEKTPQQFWFIVALPLFIVYAMRAALPDMSFDVLNYRLVNAERALAGWPFAAGDFFPAFYPLNPAPDMLLGIGRHLLGYRLGTVTNLLVLLWAGTILEKLLRPYVANKWLRSIGVLLILWTEHALFLINNYMVDVLALPLLLLATKIVLDSGYEERGRGSRLRIGIYLGACVCLKLLNLAYCIPLVLIYVYNTLRRQGVRPGLNADAGWLALGFLVPLLPFSLYIWRETGNPVFPFYNTIFHSPFWPNANLTDGRWGPRGLWETIIWPLRIAVKHDRMGELAVYSGRISIVIIVAVLVLVMPKLERRLRLLAFITLTGAVLWATMLTGYARYAVFVEMVGGVTLLGFVASLLAKTHGETGYARAFTTALAALLMCALSTQCYFALKYIAKYEWSMRATVFQNPSAYKYEMRFVLRDYDLTKFLTPAERDSLTNVGMWIESGLLTSGPQSLLDNRVPILCAYVNDYFHSAQGREKFTRALRRGGNERIASLCLQSELNSCREKLAPWKLEIIDEVPVELPFYSKRSKLKMVLLTLALLPPQSNNQQATP